MNKVEFTVIEENGDFAICWAIFKKSSDIGKHYKVWGDISLPYFFSKEELGGLNNGEGIELDETRLLIGLLLRYSSIPPLTVTHQVKPYLKPITVDLLVRFANDHNCASIDACLVRIAADVQEKYGESFSSKLFKIDPKIITEGGG